MHVHICTRTASRCTTVFMVWLRVCYKVTTLYTVYQSEPVTMSIHLLCIPVGEKEPEFGRLLLGDLQPSSALSCEAPSLSRRFSSLCAANVTPPLVRCAKLIQAINYMMKPFKEQSLQWNHHTDLHHYNKVLFATSWSTELQNGSFQIPHFFLSLWFGIDANILCFY